MEKQRPKGPPSCEARSRLASLAERLPWQSPLGAVGFGGGILHNCRDFHLKNWVYLKNEVQNFMVNIVNISIFIHFPYFFHAKNGGQRPIDIQPLGDFTMPSKLGYHRKIPRCLVNDIHFKAGLTGF
jgi:hypothetical protein